MQSDATPPVVKLAILAVGGQGGGVLSNWVVRLAELQGWVAQSTSVPGVAQRTGATIYYVEMVEAAPGRKPVLALMPSPGDIDIVVAAEWMEAGRAIQRGLVTPDRTTLVASTHRSFAIAEKAAPGDGIADADKVMQAARAAAHRVVAADLQTLAVQQGSVISASLFGALAGSGALPFPREAFEATIREGGKGIEASLRAFAAGFEVAAGTAAPGPAPLPEDEIALRQASRQPASTDDVPDPTPGPEAALTGPASAREAYRGLLERIERALPPEAAALARPGLRKVVDFQDVDYGSLYLDRLTETLETDRRCGGAAGGHALTREVAKYLANAMAYDDVIRVADLKTRGARSARVRDEVGVAEGQVLQVTEYFHPRAEEVCGMLPTRLGRAIENSPRAYRLLDRLANRGRRLRTDTLFAFVALYAIGGLRGQRRRLLRHAVEEAHLAQWLELVRTMAGRNYELAVEIARCRRLIKGYSDTHARGVGKYDRVLSAVPLLQDRDDGATWLRRLREAALKDEDGTMLDGALRTVATL